MPTITDRFLRKIGLLPASAQTMQALKDGNDLSIPRYPPIDFGVPICTPEILLERNQDIVDELKQSISDQQLFEEHYFPAMLRLANMVQQLPASATHHHRGKGGLLRHSLEVGLWAVQLAEEKYTQDAVIPQQESINEPRWKLAVFIAGIGHDLGKIVTDISVTDRSTEFQWCPYSSGLYDWTTHKGIENYYIHWQEGRGKRHITISSTLINTVMKQDTRNWISGEGPENVIWIHESLSNNPDESNKIHQFVVVADQFSVRQDLKSIAKWELETKKSPVAPQRLGRAVEIRPTATSKKSGVPQSNPSATLVNGPGAVRFPDVPQRSASAPDKSPLERSAHEATKFNFDQSTSGRNGKLFPVNRSSPCNSFRYCRAVSTISAQR